MTATIVDRRGGLKVVRQTFAVSSATHRQAIDVTPQVRGALHGAGVSNGLVIANCLHTTCAVVIDEPRPELVDHLVRLIGRLVDDDAPYKHNDPRLSDCERGNAAAHLRATILGHGVAVGVTDSELLLAGSQAIILAEWDGPRPRQMHVQIMGI
ncbi:MAG: secondary thiamine-phosphate synthase enzyme YjbQ [Candidatus Rokubacteria bacterium]|nr:secondary thiamine-phosphate synthase enzyme YjbQ [Candidatus Rokubacteria bacterium]